MARGRPEVPKYLQKKVAKDLLERQKRAGVYEKGFTDLAKGMVAGSAYPVDIADMLAKPALTPPASLKAASMRPRGGGIPETVAPVQEPKLKGTYPFVAEKMGLDPNSAEGIAGSFFSLDPLAKAHAVAMGTKLVAGKLAGLGMGAAVFGGLKKVDKAADVAKPIFTSPGKVAASDIAKEAIPANKVKSQLEGRGVNKDELEWSGFDEWIKTKKGEVPKEEVEEFFQQNQIQVQEVVMSDKTSDAEFKILAREKTADELELIMSNDEGLYNNRETIEPLIDKYKAGDFSVKEDLDEWFGGYGFDDQNYIDSVYEGVYGTIRSTDIPGNVKFGSKSWQLPGGENYRELLLIVPPKKVPWTKENVIPITAEEAAEIQSGIPNHKNWFFKAPDGVLQSRPKKQNRATDYLVDDDAPMPPPQAITQEEALQQVIDKQTDPEPRYTGGHFEEDDVVAHIRFNERVDPDGNKVLFIEEIQSDWAHKGQTEGFVTAETKAAKTRLEDLRIKINKIDDKIRPLAYEEGVLQSMAGKGPSDYKKIATVKKERLALEQERTELQLENIKLVNNQQNPVTPGPFVTDTHQWTNLALKRMIRWGTDNGFDSIGWVTGKQSADRYNVSKVVDELNIKKSFDDKGYVVTGFKGGESQNINHKVNSLDELDGVIGKDLAEKARKDLPELQKTTGDGIKPLTFVNAKITESDSQYILTLPKGDEGILGFSHSSDRNVASLNRQINWRGRNTFQVGKGTVGSKEDAMEYFKIYLIRQEKELMQQIEVGRATPTNTEYDGVTYSGIDLELGGDYHKLIYDDVLHAQGKKIGKKYGAKVEEGAIFTESGPTKTTSEEMGEYIESGQDVEDLKERLLSTGEGAKVWTMRLTDKLKQASKDGMPYYVALPPLAIGAAAAEQRTDAQRLQSKSDAQQILAN